MVDSNHSSAESPRGARRVRRHVSIAAASLSATALLSLSFSGPLRERVSLATAYVALGLLAVTLSRGPLNVLRGRPNPVSFDRRRDCGIWTAVLALVHTVIGLTVHFTGRMHLYFLAPPDAPSVLGLRADPFGAANVTGLVATLLLLLLAAISNDRSLRTLGTRRWRAVQRWAYVVLGLTIAHGALYQVLEKQRVMLVGVFVLIAVSVVGVQLAGRRQFRAVRQRN